MKEITVRIKLLLDEEAKTAKTSMTLKEGDAPKTSFTTNEVITIVRALHNYEGKLLDKLKETK